MLTRYRRVLSLANLMGRHAQAGERGQIATFLLLMIVVLLMMAMMTANLGELSMVAAQATNATDSAGLLLASQLGTRSHYYWEKLSGNTEVCYPTGFFQIILVAVMYVATILDAEVGFFGLMWSFAGALGSTNSLGKTARLLGGAYIALLSMPTYLYLLNKNPKAVGMGDVILKNASARREVLSYLKKHYNIDESAARAAIKQGIMRIVKTVLPIIIAVAIIAAAVSGQVELIPAAVGLEVSAGAAATYGIIITALAVVGLAATIYNYQVDQAQIRREFAAAEKALNGLPPKDRIQQSVLQAAMLPLVDNPTFVPDRAQIDVFGDGTVLRPGDIDGDGKVWPDDQDRVPAFARFWTRRLLQIQFLRGNATQVTSDFLNLDANAFADVAEPTYTYDSHQVCIGWDTDGNCINWQTTYDNPGFLVRAFIEGRPPVNLMGLLEYACRLLRWPGLRQYPPGDPNPNTEVYDPQFWLVGPDWNLLDSWYKQPCDPTCPPAPFGFSDEDVAVLNLQSFVEKTRAFQKGKMDVLANTWREWALDYYDPDTQDDWYDTLDFLENGGGGFGVNGLKFWRSRFKIIKNTLLPECIVWDPPGPPPPIYSNAPCKVSATGFATVDPDPVSSPTDEFLKLDFEITKLINAIDTVRPKLQDFYTTMVGIDAAVNQGNILGGLNPVTYEWDDSRGHSAVQVQTGDFEVPFVKKRHRGGFWLSRYCLEIQHAEQGGNTLWVRATKVVPHANLGFWNWFPLGSRQIVKKSCVKYTPNFVGFDNCS